MSVPPPQAGAGQELPSTDLDGTDLRSCLCLTGILTLVCIAGSRKAPRVCSVSKVGV